METFFYVGTYTQPIHFGTGEVLLGKGEGIYCIALDHDTGTARVVHVNPSVPNPSFLCCSGQGFLWAVSELKEYEGMASGAVSSFRIHRDSLALERINTVQTMGENPCYVSVDPESGLLFAANYSSGSLSVFPVNGDGSLEPVCQLITRVGSGPRADRQEGPHVHCAVPLPGMSLVLACDLGTDRICEYPIRPDNSRLSEDLVRENAAPAGSGPRHLAFSAGLDVCYVSLELSSGILTLRRDGSGWTPVQTVDSCDKSHTGSADIENLCADIHLTPDGRFLYCSNRGRDCISAFAVTPDGTLRHRGDFPCNGRTPRSFCVDPSGAYLLCANQDSDNVSIFRIRQEDGGLELTGAVEIPTPVNVVALPELD